MSKKISVIGLGYMGLPTSIILAENGFEVFGFDIDQKKIEKIKNCEPVINEPELVNRLEFVLNKNFFVSGELKVADCYLVSVPTPIDENKKANLDAVWLAGQSVAKILKKNDIVILESTSSVGTTIKLAEKIEKISGLIAGQDFFIGYSPERAIPGKTFFEVVNNNRVIGGINQESSQKIYDIYAKFVKGEISITDSNTAEMVKLVENSARDVQIAFANQVASMAYEAGINPYNLIELANKHPRVNILSPRCGVGGHCIAVDPWFLIESFPSNSKLLRASREVNSLKPFQVIESVNKKINSLNLNKKCKLLILGLAFKPDVDDLRESPALEIAKYFATQKDINLFVSEPNIKKENLKNSLSDNLVDFKNEIDFADLILVLVGHKEFSEIDWLPHLDKIIDYSGLNLERFCCNNLENKFTKFVKNLHLS